MTRNKAAEMDGMFADNVQNYFLATGRHWIKADDLIASGARYSLAAMEKAAGDDNRLSLVDIRSLPTDLKDDLLVMRGKAPEGAVERTLKGAVEAFGHPDISDYGKFATQKDYPAGTSRLDILRDFSGTRFRRHRAQRLVSQHQGPKGRRGLQDRPWRGR